MLNAGRIDLTNGSGRTSDTFTVVGNYVGQNGLVFLDTRLGDDSSPSDRLVISNGEASGLTSLGIVNAGGGGGATLDDGIMVVRAINGATTSDSAFVLSGPVAAGAFEYLLFKGGVSAGSAENWYLRSTLVPGPIEPAPVPASVAPPPVPVDPEPTVAPPEDPVQPPPTVLNPDPPLTPPDEPPVVAPPDPPPPPVTVFVPPGIPGQGVPPPTPGATPVVASVVPLYRIETATYSAIQPVAQNLGLASIGTFHERRGEQALFDGTGMLPAAWARVYGSDGDIKWSGTVDPTFDGSVVGFQVGLDLMGWESASGHQDRAGLFIDHGRADGDVRGQALGWNDLSVGGIKLNSTSVGAYWTHIGPQGWYLDGVVLASWLDGDATSNRGIGIDIDGTGIAASLEGGYPFQLTPGVTLEPQAQLIWQHFSIDDAADRFSTVSFDDGEALTGRIGLRLQAELAMGGAVVRPYAKVNLWRGLSGSQDILFGATTISTETDATTLEVGGGLVAELTKAVSFHVTGGYSTNLGGERQRVVEGNIGLTVNW